MSNRAMYFPPHRRDRVKIIIMVPVDDMIVISSEDDCTHLHLKPSQLFPMKSLRRMEQYTGHAFERDREAGA